MKRRLFLFALMSVIGLQEMPLLAQSAVLVPMEKEQLSRLAGQDEQLWGNSCNRGDRSALLQAVNQSLRYLNTASAQKAYRNYPVQGVTRDRVRRSLQRFKTLLQQSTTPRQLQQAVQWEFEFYQAIGNDNQGTVHFTGYFEPIYTASRVRTAEYRYPIYRQPKNFKSWSKPHPSRAELEGIDGLGHNSPLKGQELAWFNKRLDAYLIQVQGSAKLNWISGGQTSIAFAGTTDYDYTSLGKETIKEGIFQPGEVTLPKLITYFDANPAELDRFIPRNNRLVFFRETSAATPAKGSLGVPVTAERSVATDKSLMPPGALAVLVAPIPDCQGQKSLVSRYVLDQDTGSAIKGPGRVDIFMGTGQLAGDRAGLMSDDGQLYYLLLKR